MNDLAPWDLSNLHRFLVGWYGDPTFPAIKREFPPLAPEILVKWHDISSEWGDVITPQNYAIPLSELEAEGDYVPFWSESQGGWTWSFRLGDPDQRVYERDEGGEGSGWVATDDRLLEFLIHATVLEAILGAKEMRVAGGVALKDVLSQADRKEVQFSEWNWPAPGSRILMGERWLALVHPDLDAHEVTVAANRPEDLAWVDGISSAGWQSYTLEDHSTDDPLPW
ncbi:hypothetical protein ACIPUC_31725 [Streptomyces sp. LARHCF249]